MSSDFPSNTAKVLWINGPAGYGKTIICARLVQYLSMTVGSPLAYYFFSSESENREDPFVIIRSWLSQVVDYDQNAYQVAYERWQMRGHTASRTEIMELFRLVVQSTPNCIFVVDGLDECVWLKDSSPIGFLTALKQAIAQTTSRIMIVSRDEVSIRSGIRIIPTNDPNQTLYEHTISPGDVQSDIERFCRSTIDKKLPNKKETIRGKLSQRMVERCNGMFLWVKMQEDNLRGGKSIKQLEQVVDDAPTGLEHLYDRNWTRLSNLPDYDRARAFSILRWAAFALRPLTVLELTEALLVVDDDSCDDLLVDQIPEDIDDEYVNGEIVGLCGSLIEIQGEASKRSLGSLTVHLTHFSVKQYILCKMSAPGLSDMTRLLHSNKVIQSNELAKICLRYLNFGRVWQQPGLSKDNLSSRPFRNYAARFWHQHIITDSEGYAGVVELINILFNPKNSNWASWKMWFDSLKPLSNLPEAPKVSSASPLYYASLLRLHDTVVYLTEKLRLDINNVDEHQRTALQAACSQDCLSIVKILLEKGADVAVATNDGLTPLHIASSNGHTEAVKALLEKGADITVTGNNGSSPLYLASSNGHVEVVKVLLEEGADAALVNKDGFTPQYIATCGGYVEVVKVLLEKGADATAITKDRWTLLHVASSNQHVELVRMLLEKGANATAVTNDRWTSLHLASGGGHVEVVNALLEKGTDVAAVSEDGWTPLHSASRGGHVGVVNVLLEKGADASAITKAGLTPLHLASFGGYFDVVNVLLEKGADVAARGEDGWTPLYSASCNGHVEVVNMLLEKGADAAAVTKAERTLLHLASSNGHVDVVNVLLEKGADVAAVDEDGWTLLHSASCDGHVEVVNMLLEKGADAAAVTKAGRTLLHLASSNGHVDVVKELLEKGADVAAVDKDGLTPLHSASCDGHVEVVKVLLEKEANIMAMDNNSFTPLHLASRNGHVELVKVLLEKEASIMAMNNNGFTPLHSASCDGHIEVAKVLLENGADAAAVSNDGWTPLRIASCYGHVELAKMLLEKGADVVAAGEEGLTPLHSASCNGHVEVVNVLLEKGADVAATGEDGWTPLHSASCDGHVEVVKELLKKGADAAAVTKAGRTPLHLASLCGHIEVVNVLLEKGADVAATGEDGWTPLHSASCNGHVEVVKELLEKGADAAAVEEDGWTPLHSASHHGHIEVVKILLENGADITIANGVGRTSISVAAKEGHESIFTLMLDYGDVSKFTRHSLHDLICSLAYRGCLAPLRLLIERHHMDHDQRDIQGRNVAHFAAQGGQVDILEYLLTSGANPYAVDVQGNGLLYYAALGGSVDMVRKTIPFYKATPASCMTWSPLHWACRSGSAAVVNLLLEHGFCESVVTTTEPEGRWTPYAIAVFHHNQNLVCDSEDDTHSSYTVDLELLGYLTSNELVTAKKHDSCYCDGCQQVCTRHLIVFRSSNRLGYIWCPLSLFGMCRF